MLSENITEWLVRWSNGEDAALDQLTPLVYNELRRLAAAFLERERDDHTLQATALVHEAYLQIRKIDGILWKDRAHFMGIAARIMRRILVEHARRRQSAKRGGALEKISADLEEIAVQPDLNLMALDEALNKLANEHPRQAQVVELRFFGGLTSEETARVMSAGEIDVSSRTVERDWRFARAWLHSAMAQADPLSPNP